MDGFSDPMVDCKETKLRFRADQLFYAPVLVDGQELGYVCVHQANDETMLKDAKKQAKPLVKAIGKVSRMWNHLIFKNLLKATEEQLQQIPSPASGLPTLTAPREFQFNV